MIKLIILLLVLTALTLIIAPLIKIIIALYKPSPVKQAKLRLKQIEEELEVAKINKQSNDLIDKLYAEELNNDHKDHMVNK
jgi:hypothetical protein